MFRRLGYTIAFRFTNAFSNGDFTIKSNFSFQAEIVLNA